MKVAIIAIVLMDITIGLIWFGRHSHRNAQHDDPPIAILSSLRPRPVFIPPEATFQVCVLHGNIRTNGVVPVYYGTPGFSADYETFDKAKRASFPNSWTSLHGGCVIEIINGERSATQAVVNICPLCREAAHLWKEQHGKHSSN